MIVDDRYECHECGEPFVLNENYVATHVDKRGDPDFELDADHVPYSLEDQP